MSDILLYPEPNSNHYYNMEHKKRGLALIFNHGKFDCNSPREGTQIDRGRLEKTLQFLDFDVRIYDDKNISEIRSILEDVAAMNHSDNDCLMIVVLTHGELVPLKNRKGESLATILTHDLFSYLHATDNKYPLQYIWENFTDERCPTLKNKPRIFIIQACQGSGEDRGHPIHIIRPKRPFETDITTFVATNHMPFDKVKLERSKTLPQRDFLIVYSSMPGYYSYRDTEDGTWFIKALCEQIHEHAKKLDLFRMLTLTCQKVAIDRGEFRKQMPCIVSMLTKLIMFKEKDRMALTDTTEDSTDGRTNATNGSLMGFDDTAQ